MRLQCDVCEEAAADLMCCADEAALCTDCDVKVHEANILAVKHQRIPLLKDADSPRCDICQDKTGFFFCLQDRALLCRGCDVSIHSANPLSSAHHRFLVTGIRVALEAATGAELAAASPEESLKSVAFKVSSPPIVHTSSVKTVSQPARLVRDSRDVSATFLKPPSATAVSGVRLSPSMPNVTSGVQSPVTTLSVGPRTGSMCASVTSGGDMKSSTKDRPRPATQIVHGNSYKWNNSIREFLTEAIPGWRVDELLNIQDTASGYTLGDLSSAKVDVENLGNFDWAADLSLFDEQVCTNSFHEVPELLFSSFSCPRSGREATSLTKGTGKQNFAMVPEFDDAFTVPDLDLRPLPDSPPVIKRRRM